MPNGGPNEQEQGWQNRLYRSIAASKAANAVPAAPATARVLSVSEETSLEEEAPDTDPVAVLEQSRAQARTAQLSAAAAAADNEEAEIPGIAGRANHFLLQALMDLFAFDMSCCFVTVLFTFPIYDVLVVGIFGYQLYNSVTGNKSNVPFFPKLTWESFAPPGTNISVPLPDTVLKVMVLAGIINVVLANLVGLGLMLAVLEYAGVLDRVSATLG